MSANQKRLSKKAQTSGAMLRRLVNKGFSLWLQSNRIREQLETAKAALRACAERQPQQHVPLGAGKGTEWVADGKRCRCHVIFPSPRWVSLEAASDEARALRRSLGKRFKGLFKPVTYYVPAVDKAEFLAAVDELPPRAAARVLELCLQGCEPRVTWKSMAPKSQETEGGAK
jgi:hypothetical protein